MSDHSTLGPSAADRWMNCPGSVNATSHLPDDRSSIYAAEGTFAHLVSEICREEGYAANSMVGYSAEVDGYKFTVDKLMATYIQKFLDYEAQFDAEDRLNEVKVWYEEWVPGGFGTLDAGLLSDGTCVIIDLKYGKGVQVYAENNVQLMLYALGVYQEYGACGLYDIESFRLCISQPRLDWIDEWEISVDYLLMWANEVVRPAAAATFDADAPFKAGRWCQWCKLKSTCKTRADLVMHISHDELDELRNVAEMSTEELGEAASLIPAIRQWTKDVMDRVEHLVMERVKVIGDDGLPFKMVEGRGSRAWRDTGDAEKAMRNHKMRVKDIFTKKLISPAQFEKAFGRDHVIIQKHCERKQGKPTLVKGSDPRPSFELCADEMEVIPDDE